MQPGGKGRLTPKASNLSKQLDEDFLSEILCLRDIAGHSQTERVNPAIMPLVKLLKGWHVALSRLLRQGEIRLLRRLDFGCGHVFVLGKQRKCDSLRVIAHEYHLSAYFKGAAT